MAEQYADATALRDPRPSWLMPGAAIVAVVGLAFVAASSGLSNLAGGDVVTAPGVPPIGSSKGASLAIGERPFAYLEFDWDPASGVPGFDPAQEPFRLITDASAW